MSWALLILGLVALQRLAELVIANRNTKRLLAEGASELGASHYPFIVAVHTSWLVAIAAWIVVYNPAVDWFWLGVYAILQILRVWVMASLGRYWTTRIIHVPNAQLVRRGPYKFIRHPNYTVVALEIIVLPLVFGAPPIALVFTALNAAVLWVRIKAEDSALSQRS